MIKWIPNLYLDPITRKYEKKIKRKAEQKKRTVFFYCIALAANGNNLFDIIYMDELLFRYYEKKEMTIVGIASTKESAVSMVADIVSDLYANTGGFDAHSYFNV